MATTEAVKHKRFRKLKLLAVVMLIFSLLLTGCTDQQIEDSVDLALDVLVEILDSESTEPTQESDTHEQTQSPTIVNGTMEVHFIDVGQSDATLFIQNGYVMLFDTAIYTRGDELVEYIQSLGIDYIDVMIISHPHDDHGGGSSVVLNNIEVGKIYGPDFFDIMEYDSSGNPIDPPDWYELMIDAVDAIDEKNNQGVPEDQQTSIWHFPKDENGEFAKFNIGDAVVEFMAPLEDEYSDKNDYSICAKVTYGNIDIMLTGDATSSVERDLIAEGYDLDVEIFQASHHGSDTGNSREFLEVMTPECIVISCGMNNRYSHPIKSVVDLYKEMNIPVYRTDESGNIVLTTDGTEYSFNVEPGTYTSGAEYKEQSKGK